MEAHDITFHEITMEDKRWMDEKFAEEGKNACEYTFANNFIWRKRYGVAVAEICGCLIVRSLGDDSFVYSYPVGEGDKKEAIVRLLALCQKAGQSLFLFPVLEAERRQLAEWFPGRFLIAECRDNFDYIYSREKLETLAGKKLHGKRNHIARFKDEGDWRYEPLTAENAEDCRQMTYTWIRMRSEKWNEEMNEEIEVLHEAFDHREELGLVGGVLYRGEEIVAFTMGEPLTEDTFVVHFEKAYPMLQGAYPMINQQFVQHACGAFDYVNREDDTGDEGLRKAKLSYYPEILLKKYSAAESTVVFADRGADADAVKKLWTACFDDTEADVAYYMEQRMTNENMLVIHAEGKIVSMASFLPVQYRIDGAYTDAYYVYAVGTLPEYRGRGYATQILEFAKAWYRAPLLLAPADEGLTDYYAQRGFKTAFLGEWHRQERVQEGASLRALELQPQEALTEEPVSPEEYVRIRDERLEKEGYVRRDAEAVRYAMGLNKRGGGETVAVVSGAPDGKERDVVMYYPQGERLCILETTLLPDKLERFLPVLFAKTGTKTAETAALPGMCWLPGHMKDCGSSMGYLGLTLA